MRDESRVIGGRKSAEPASSLREISIPAISWSADDALRVTAFSSTDAALARDLGRRIAGQPLAGLREEDALPLPPREACDEALRGKASAHRVFWRGREFQSHVGPLYGPGQRIVGCTGFSQDVRALRWAQSALRESEGRYQAISELTSTYAYSALLEPGGHLFPEWVTGDFVQITGYTLDEITQLGGPLKLIHSADRSVAVKRTERLLAGEPSVSEFRIITKSGATRWLRDYGRPVQDDAQRRTIRIFGAAQDITDRKQAEQALRESEERFRLVFEEGPLGMLTLNAEGVLLEVNRSLAQMLGYAPEELAGRRTADVVHPDDLDASTEMLAKVSSGEATRCTWEKRYLARDGRIVWARVTATALHDPEGHRLCILGMIEDITDRKRTEQALRRAERLASIGTLAAGIAHEINNPLGAITLSVDAVTLSEEQPDHEAILKVALDNIRASALRCGRIVKSVLQFARGEVSQKSPGDLAEVVRHAHDMARSFAAQRDVSLRLEIPGDSPPVVMNTTEMGQVFINLISNAIYASGPGDSVTVRMVASRQVVQVAVEDHGCGMTEEEIDRMFDPFFTSRPDEGGTGLGLSITYGIVERHEGTIDVASQVGHGTTVTIALPAVKTTPEERAAPVQKSEGPHPHVGKGDALRRLA